MSFLDLGWMYANDKIFLDFVKVLNGLGNTDIFMTDFIKTLLEVYW